MLGLKLNHVSKRGHCRWQSSVYHKLDVAIPYGRLTNSSLCHRHTPLIPNGWFSKSFIRKSGRSIWVTRLVTSSNGNICLVTGPLWGESAFMVDSPHKGLWRRALMLHLMCAWTKAWANSPDAGDLRRHAAHCDVTVMRMSSYGVRIAV